MSSVTIGILAIQGAVSEHVRCFTELGASCKEIRSVADFADIDGIILPGGESTAMAIIGEKYGLFPKLKSWVQSKKPIWGTCAGMILLSDHAIKTKTGGQSLVGGLDVHVCRNFFGPQISSRKIEVPISLAPRTEQHSGPSTPAINTSDSSSSPFPAYFIRAPAILRVGPEVEVLCQIKAKPHASAKEEVGRFFEDSSRAGSSDDDEVLITIAALQGNILATSFHPELTKDLRWHQYFLALVESFKHNSV